VGSHRVLLISAIVATALLSGGSSLHANQVGPGEFHLNASVREILAQIQQDWSEWLAAHELDDASGEEDALADLMTAAEAVGMSTLPDLSLGASARAVESAKVGDFLRAARALDAAERLDPRRPETSFGRATVHHLQKDWWGFLAETVSGYVRILRLPVERRVWLDNAMLWGLTSLLLAGCAFVAVLMLVRGPALFGSLLEVLRKRLPVPVAVLLILVGLLWPLALSSGVLAVALNWSILLWVYCQRSERWVLAILFLLFGMGPILLDEQRRRAAVEISPMARAAEDARLGNLRGRLFGDLQRLTLALPNSVPVAHLLADQHRRIGQCDTAMSLYRKVNEAEPENAAALIDLGSCYFLRGEYDQAIDLYGRGISVDDSIAEAHFNLGLAYSELYRFADSGRSLSRAQAIDSSRVAAWLSQSSERGVAEVGLGLRRSREVRKELLDAWVFEGGGAAAWSSPWRDYLSLPLAVFGLLAVAVAGRIMPTGHLEAQAPPLVDWGNAAGSVYRIVVPGLPELEAGESLRGLIALVSVTGLLLIPWVGSHGYRLPWGLEPAMRLSWVATLLGLAVFYYSRWRRETAW